MAIKRGKMSSKQYGSRLFILDGSDIIEAVEEGYLFISPFIKTNVQLSSYDVSIDKIAKYRKKKYYVESDREEVFEDFSELLVEPGESLLFLSMETFTFPQDMIGRIGLRSRYCRLLNSAESMGRIENGWSGKIVLEISNRSRDRKVKLSHGEPIASIEVFQFIK